MATENKTYYIIQVFDTMFMEWCLHRLCGYDIDKAIEILKEEQEKNPELTLEIGTCKRQWWNEKGWD